MNISLPDSLKDFVDEQVAGRGYDSRSECVPALIRKDRARQRLRDVLLEGTSSPLSTPADSAYFSGLRRRARTGRTPVRQK